MTVDHYPLLMIDPFGMSREPNSPSPSPIPNNQETPSAQDFNKLFWEERKDEWIFPLNVEPLFSPLTDGRGFGAQREVTDPKTGAWIRDRLHAGIDLKQVAGTDVISMANNTVIEVLRMLMLHLREEGT